MENEWPEATGNPTSNEKVWGVLAHLTVFLCSPLSCLLLYFTIARGSQFIREQTTAALNFQITLFIASFGLSLVMTIGDPSQTAISLVVSIVWIIVIVWVFVFVIQAALAAYRGQLFHYPISLRLIKGG